MELRFSYALVLLLTSQPVLAQTVAFNEANPQFGAVTIRESSPPKIISMSNVSTTPIFLSEIRATDDFAQSNRCPIWLAEGSGCVIFITFTPRAAGSRSGELVVDWAGGGGQSILLSGLGLPSPESHSGAVAPSSQRASRTTNDEERAQELRNDKKYSFEALLSKSAADVANSETIFALTKDTEAKRRIASVLVHIGIPVRIYFDYLTNEAKKALAHDQDMPWPICYGKDRKSDSASPAFVEWVKNNRLPFWDAYNVSVYEIPSAWYELSAAGDPRTYDLLIKGLHSPNLMIAGTAAGGLAKLQDARAIDELIATGRQMRGEPRLIVARSLLFFPDPKAHAAAEELTPEEEKNWLELQRQDIKARGMRVLFPW